MTYPNLVYVAFPAEDISSLIPSSKNLPFIERVIYTVTQKPEGCRPQRGLWAGCGLIIHMKKFLKLRADRGKFA